MFGQQLLRHIHGAVHALGDTISLNYAATNQRLNRIERLLMSVREEFNQSLAELGQSIVDLDDRIQNFPADVNDVTQADVDAIRQLSGKVKSLAVQAPEVPTDTEPSDPDVVGQDPSTDQTFGTGFAGEGQSNA